MDREDSRLTLEECKVALAQQLAALEAVARIGRDHEDEQVGTHDLRGIVEEGVASARLFGRHIAEPTIEVGEVQVRLKRSLGVLLVCVIVLDVLERHGRGPRQHPVRLSWEGELVLRHSAPEAPEPGALRPVCEAVGATWERRPGELRVRL